MSNLNSPQAQQLLSTPYSLSPTTVYRCLQVDIWSGSATNMSMRYLARFWRTHQLEMASSRPPSLVPQNLMVASHRHHDHHHCCYHHHCQHRQHFRHHHLITIVTISILSTKRQGTEMYQRVHYHYSFRKGFSKWVYKVSTVARSLEGK